MLVGVPKEIKTEEYRVGVTPGGVAQFVHAGHHVLVQKGAGEGSGFGDEEYRKAGANVVADAREVYGRSDMVVKVKELIEPEYDLIREGGILFTYLHLAADEKLTQVLMKKKVRAIAYETVELPDGTLPLLTPMSEIAGRLSIQVGAWYLQRPNGGSGRLLGGVPGVLPANVVIIGGGVVGSNAAEMALGLGATVTIITRNVERLRFLSQVFYPRGRLYTLASNTWNVASAVKDADLVIGSVLVPGAKAPKMVTRDMIRTMRQGSVVVDVAVDQGGCFETTRPTTHADPIYLVDGVIHYCVTNMPGSVPRTATLALTNATMPYALQLANKGFERAVKEDPALAMGVNTYAGNMTCSGVADAFGLECAELGKVLAA